jgi:hypothetical protein
LKTQITDFLFLFNTVKQVIDNNLSIDLKIFYFTLEMSKEEKMLSAFSNILYEKEGLRINPTQLKSTKADNILSEETLTIIDKYEPYFKKIEEIVEFVDDIKNPTGIYKFVRSYAHSHGTQHTKTVEFVNNKTGEVKEKEIDDYYTPDNPEEYVIVLIDHVSLIGTETLNGKKLSLHESIVKLSSDYLITLRNKFNYIPVLIQQQASSQESVENMKHNRLKPTLDGLGDCKLTQRDANVVLGLFSPFRHEIPAYYNYDITKFKDNIRFLEVLASREGGGGTICPLYFDGAVNYFKELPKPDNTGAMAGVYRVLDKIRGN